MSAGSPRGPPRFDVSIDFDGTLVGPNVAIVLVEKFGRDGKRVAHEVDELLHTGRLTLREAWERQAALLPADRLVEMTRFAVDNVALRPGAKELLSLLGRHRVPTTIVSGGLRFYIDAVLAREGIDLPVLSDSMSTGPDGQLRVSHPYAHPTCRLCGICKAQVVAGAKDPDGSLRVYIGDGSTDRYAAEVADVVFARHRLLAYCQKAGIPCVPFEEFGPVTASFESWLERGVAPPARPTRGDATSPCPISQELASAYR